MNDNNNRKQLRKPVTDAQINAFAVKALADLKKLGRWHGDDISIEHHGQMSTMFTAIANAADMTDAEGRQPGKHNKITNGDVAEDSEAFAEIFNKYEPGKDDAAKTMTVDAAVDAAVAAIDGATVVYDNGKEADKSALVFGLMDRLGLTWKDIE